MDSDKLKKLAEAGTNGATAGHKARELLIIRDKIVTCALNEVGTHENPKGSNLIKYNDWYYGRDGVKAAWCSNFVCWVFHHAGFPLPEIDKKEKGTDYVPNFEAYAKANDMFTDKPVCGDLAIFEFNGKAGGDHIGIFVKTAENDPDKHWIVEGNTSSGDVGSQDNGDQVAYKRRGASLIVKWISIQKFIEKYAENNA